MFSATILMACSFALHAEYYIDTDFDHNQRKSDYLRIQVYEVSKGPYAIFLPSVAQAELYLNDDNIVNRAKDVGAHASVLGYYGTFDRGNKLREWNDSIAIASTHGSMRRTLTSSFDFSIYGISESERLALTGFDLIDSPETSLAPMLNPSAYALIVACLIVALIMIRRRGQHLQSVGAGCQVRSRLPGKSG